jgi:23S rRNA (guanosine2251-2'-O)-methyltransferase
MRRPARQTDPRSGGANARRHQHTDYNLAPSTATEDDLPSLIASADSPLVLVLDQVTDPHNLGACLRTADAAGVCAVIVPKDNSALLTDTVRHIACGAAERVPFIAVTNLARAMERLQELGVWLTGTADKADKLLYEVDFKGPTGIVMGAEGSGMRRLTTEKCDFLIRIPMSGTVPCLNVSVATGVVLFEVVRQRHAAAV